MSFLTVKNIVKSFGKTEVLKDVSFEMNPTSRLALIGKSGSGKTTMLRIIAGLEIPNSGEVAINDTVLNSKQEFVKPEKRNIGYVFQNHSLFPHLNVYDNIVFGIRKVDKKNKKQIAQQYLSMLGLEDKILSFPHQLSGGEKQRVALARALMSDPAILLMDEPLAALDAPRKAEIMPYLTRLRDVSQIPIIYVSHDMSEVARLATTVIMMRDGAVVCAGPADEILSDPALMPLIGAHDAGAVIVAQISEIDHVDGLSTLTFSGGQIVLPGTHGDVGQDVRLRIPAQDVILSRTKPDAISAINVLPVLIHQLVDGTGPGVAVGLQAGDARFLARITRQSAKRLNLAVGDEIYAILKATAMSASHTDIG